MYRCVRISRPVRLCAAASLLAIAAAMAGAVAMAAGDVSHGELRGGTFRLSIDGRRGGITCLARTGTEPAINFLRDNGALGDVELRVRVDRGPWQPLCTAGAHDRATVEPSEDGRAWTLRYASLAGERGGPGLALSEIFRIEGSALCWTIQLRNNGPAPLEIGDLALPLPMRTNYGWNKEETFNRALYRQQFISGHGSFLFWYPVGGRGPHLVMLPQPGSKLEFFTETKSDYAHGGGRFTVMIHSAATGPQIQGTWRQPHTGLALAPGQSAEYGFTFHWADDLAGVREVLYRNGGFDIWAVPGMVVPEDVEALIALRTRNRITAIEPEFPAETRIDGGKGTGPCFRTHVAPEINVDWPKNGPVPGRPVERREARTADTQVFRVKFSRLGENRLKVRYDGNRVMYLEFFVTQPLETLIKKRAAFVARQQHRDPTKWYNGLFSLWDVRMPEGKNLLGPENPAGQAPHAVSGSDDPSNGKSLYLSEKNVAYPDAREIAALEYFIEHFVWGKHQRTDSERPYPHGIYGADSWQQNRFTRRDPLDKGVSRPGGPSACRMWRTFDYTTYFALYYNMYRIARQNPALVKHLDARRYLERAYGTARAYFEVPANIRMEGGWAFTGWVYWQYTVGNFHEKYLPDIIEALEREGEKQKAAYLRAEWEKKVKYFIYDDRYPWASEMPVDSTAFESTYAVARYALQRGLEPDERLWHDKNRDRWFSHTSIDPARHRDFLERQLAANLACRGSIVPAYYVLGSDFRGCGQSFYMLSYMSQMGGWSVLDQGLRFDADPAPLLRLGSASMLSSWALVNAGPAKSNHGFWWPGPRHDGAAGWGFTTQKSADEWNPAVKNHARGPWPVDGEIDHGLTAGVEAASTVALEDPIFGWIAMPGTLVRDGAEVLRVVPKDGVRQRFHLISGRNRLHATLDRDGFAADRPILVDPRLQRLELEIENRSEGDHQATLTLEGLPPGDYVLHLDRERNALTVGAGLVAVKAPMNNRAPTRVVIQRR